MAKKTPVVASPDAATKPASADPTSIRGSTSVDSWINEIQAARTRDKSFREQGRRLVKIYEGDMKATVPFNILYSNTETMAPNLYSATPQPDVKARYDPKSPMPKLAASIVEAYLDFFITTNNLDTADFDDLMKQAVLEGLVTGRGCTRFCYTADVEKDAGGQPKKIKYDAIYGEHMPYDRVIFGYAKTWEQVPWLAYEYFWTRDEAQNYFGTDADLSTVKFTEFTNVGKSEDGLTSVDDSEGVELALFYQIWNKREREVFFIADSDRKHIFKSEDDPYGLVGFFPQPRPIQFVRKISSMTPRALYALYENQADELNKLTIRINKITAAIKATGFYNSGIDGLSKVLETEDGVLNPLDNVQSLGDNADLDKAIWMWPVEILVNVLNTLSVQRESVKNVIYEIMGIADILRGASVASETLGAQKIKAGSGGLRMQNMRLEVARYVRDCLRIVGDLAFKKLQPKTLMMATATPLPSAKEQEQAKNVVTKWQMEQQLAAAHAQMMPPQPGPGPQPQPGQPPQPDQGQPPPSVPPQSGPPPEIQQAMQTLQLPSADAVFAALQSSVLADYMIDIETDSTVDAAATEDKENLNEFLAAMSQFFLAIGPLVQEGVIPFGAAKAMLLAISRKFKLGRELDEELEQMQPPQQQGGAQQAEIQKAQQQLQQDQQQLTVQKAQFGMDQTKAKGQMQMDQMQSAMKNMMEQMRNRMTNEKDKAQIELLMTKFQGMIDQHNAEVQSAFAVHDAQTQAGQAVQDAQTQAQQIKFDSGQRVKEAAAAARQQQKAAKPAKGK